MDCVRSYFGRYKWTSEQLNTFFLTFWLVCCVTSQKVRKKVFNWSEVYLYQSNFLQNPYFSLNRPITCLINHSQNYKTLSTFSTESLFLTSISSLNIAAAHVWSSQRLTAPQFQYIFQFATVLHYCAAENQKECLKQKKMWNQLVEFCCVFPEKLGTNQGSTEATILNIWPKPNVLL